MIRVNIGNKVSTKALSLGSLNYFKEVMKLLFLAPLAAVAIEISIPVGALATTLGLGIGKGIITAIKKKKEKKKDGE